MITSTKKLPALLTKAIKAGLVSMISGSPAIGKSDIVRQLAKKNKLKVIDLRLSQCDPVDLLGFPTIDKENNKSSYVPMDTFPIKGDKIPDGYNGWLLFLDELNSAPLSVQSAAFKLVLDKQVGNNNTLHDKVFIIAAGNLESDKGITSRLSTPMQSRLVHFEVEVDNEAWLEWAEGLIDYRVIAYINFRPEALYMFDPNHSDKTFSSPRTWEFVSKITKGNTIDSEDLPLLCGCVGEAEGRQFYAFSQIFHELPTITQITSNPEKLDIPVEPSTLYAISGLLAHNIDISNIENIMKYAMRMPIEFQIITLQNVIKKDTSLIRNDAVKDWVSVNAKNLF